MTPCGRPSPRGSRGPPVLLRQAIEAALGGPALAGVRRTLLLDASYPTSEFDYRRLVRLKSIAARQGYPELV